MSCAFSRFHFPRVRTVASLYPRADREQIYRGNLLVSPSLKQLARRRIAVHDNSRLRVSLETARVLPRVSRARRCFIARISLFACNHENQRRERDSIFAPRTTRVCTCDVFSRTFIGKVAREPRLAALDARISWPS